MLSRTLHLDFARSRFELRACIERALALVNEAHELSFAHDGAELEEGVEFTVWTDDPQGATESSWLQLIDSPADQRLWLSVNAINEAELEVLISALATALEVAGA